MNKIKDFIIKIMNSIKMVIAGIIIFIIGIIVNIIVKWRWREWKQIEITILNTISTQEKQ